MQCIYLSCTVCFYIKVPHRSLKGNGEAKLLEGKKPKKFLSSKRQAMKGNISYSRTGARGRARTAGWHRGCCKG